MALPSKAAGKQRVECLVLVGLTAGAVVAVAVAVWCLLLLLPFLLLLLLV
jgi:hypothetical protein